MLECADGSFYVGITSNIEQRIAQHAAGWDPRAYTHTRRPVKLVHCEDFSRVDDAIRWEKQLKGWSRAKKRALIAGDWAEIRRLARPSTGSALRQAQDDK
jgi:predicted GIY-YIG superfamily endonuclease